MYSNPTILQQNISNFNDNINLWAQAQYLCTFSKIKVFPEAFCQCLWHMIGYTEWKAMGLILKPEIILHVY